MMIYWGLVFSAEMLSCRNGAGQVKLFNAFQGLHSILETEILSVVRHYPPVFRIVQKMFSLDRWL